MVPHDPVDIARKGNSKGKRLTQYVESQGGSMRDVIAFGDNYNDISMLEAAVPAWRWQCRRRGESPRQRGDW